MESTDLKATGKIDLVEIGMVVGFGIAVGFRDMVEFAVITILDIVLEFRFGKYGLVPRMRVVQFGMLPGLRFVIEFGTVSERRMMVGMVPGVRIAESGMFH